MYLGTCAIDKAFLGTCELSKVYLGVCEVLGGGQSAVIFYGVTPDPDTFVMTDVFVGTSPITDARVADIELPDYQGVYQTFGQELAYEGGRVTGAEDSRVVYADDGVDPLAEVPWLVHAPQATNYFLNSHAPAPQTVSGRTGSHTVWIDGSGSVAVTGGIMGTVTDGSPLTGDPGGSDVILTVTGVPDFVQFENNAFPTFPIETAGAAVTRDACDIEIPSINHSDQGDKYTLEVVVTGGPCNVLGTFLQYDGANFVLTDGTNSQSVAAAIGEHSIEILYSSADGEMSLSVDGSARTPVAYNGTLQTDAEFKAFSGSSYVGKIRNVKRYGPDALLDYILYDSFTDTDGTFLRDHTPEAGGTWEDVDENVFTLESGEATPVNTTVSSYAITDVGPLTNFSMDVTLSCTRKSTVDRQACYWHIRFVDTNNFVRGSVNPYSGTLDIIELVAGVANTLVTVNFGNELSATLTGVFTTTVIDNEITVTSLVNGVTRTVSTTTSRFANATKVGIQSWGKGSYTPGGFDFIKIKQL